MLKRAASLCVGKTLVLYIRDWSGDGSQNDLWKKVPLASTILDS